MHTHVPKKVSLVRDKHNELLCANMKLYIWSDDCASQFKSRVVIALMTHFVKSCQLAWYYNEFHNGKGVIDDIDGAVKNKVFRDIKSFKVQVYSSQCLTNYVDKVKFNVRI